MNAYEFVFFIHLFTDFNVTVNHPHILHFFILAGGGQAD